MSELFVDVSDCETDSSAEEEPLTLLEAAADLEGAFRFLGKVLERAVQIDKSSELDWISLF